jgi:hypothetical protein
MITFKYRGLRVKLRRQAWRWVALIDGRRVHLNSQPEEQAIAKIQKFIDELP